MSYYERYLAELATYAVTVFQTRAEAEAALDEAGIVARDYRLFMDVVDVCDCKVVFHARLDQARKHILNVNSAFNVNYRPGVHRRGSEVWQ